MSNFTSNYLGLLKKQGELININSEGIEIDTIYIEQNPTSFNYFKPRMIIDRFQENISANPEIRKISIQDLGRLGFVIATIQRKHHKWWKGQMVEYRIMREYLVKNKLSILNVPPNKHYLEYDRANSVVRIVGRNSGAFGKGRWTKV